LLKCNFTPSPRVMPTKTFSQPRFCPN
jgi:hypothetical protein